MVKHQKEKLYPSAREQRANSQLRSNSLSSSSKARPLPFNCCALTLTPFVTPICTPNGILFETNAILPYLLKYKKDPVSGNSMTTRDLITLNMDKNTETKEWQCPILQKSFSNHSKIVAIRQSNKNQANVYSYEAVQELNFKSKNYIDLISGDKFHKQKDVIWLLDPNNERLNQLRDIHHFQHTKTLRKEQKLKDQSNSNIRHSVTASRIMEKIHTQKRQREEIKPKTHSHTSTEKKLKILTEDVLEGAKLTTGKTSGSFTSTSMSISNTIGSREATSDEIQNAHFQAMKKLKKKGYVQLQTNLGNLEIELHCDIVPRTTTNFLSLADEGFYNGSKFHRCIRNFMIQGGKPKNSKTPQKSIWGKPFQDEFDDRLTHSEKGILSMANSGPHSNQCQFFITFKSCPHLNRKHSIFGQVIQGLEVLKQMENIATDSSDKPLEKIKIQNINVLVNPAREAQQLEKIRIEAAVKQREEQQNAKKQTALGRKSSTSTTTLSVKQNQKQQKEDGFSIGKYLPKHTLKGLKDDSTVVGQEDDNSNSILNVSRLPPPPKKTTFGDFSAW